MRIEGAMDGEAFCARIAQVLAPTLRPGDMVVCDNRSIHKNARAAIAAGGAELCFLPASAPDLNPIAMVARRSRPSSATLPRDAPIPSATPVHRP
jgi:transposase